MKKEFFILRDICEGFGPNPPHNRRPFNITNETTAPSRHRNAFTSVLARLLSFYITVSGYRVGSP